MTQLEATALAKRLERVWKPVKWPFCHSPEVLLYPFVIVENIKVRVWAEEDNSIGAICLWAGTDRQCRIWCEDGKVEVLGELASRESKYYLAAEWLPTFRRNCWLSGCPLEASVHEKMTWLDYGRELGMTEEELKCLI